MIVRFTKKDKSTFPYWFAHWCAYQMIALNLKAWKWKYLFHDAEKPWLKLFMEYPKVQLWHRKHNKHHLLYYFLYGKADWEAMIIDWECCRFTKQDAQLNARDTLRLEMEQLISKNPENKTIKILNNMGYDYEHSEWYKRLSQVNIELNNVLNKFGL